MRSAPSEPTSTIILKAWPEQEVADEHARLVAPEQTRRGLAAPEIALVDHVVMQQRRGMHELDARREPHMAVATVAAELRRGDGEHGPQALAAGIDQMPGKIGDQLDIGTGTIEDDAVDMTHILLDKRKQRRKACPWITRIGKLDNDSQRTAPQRRLRCH